MRGSVLPLLVTVSLLGCAREPEYGAALGQEDPAAEDTDHAVAIEVPTPEWTAAEVAALMEETLAGGLPAPFSPRDRYVALFDAHAEEGCPTSELPYHLPGDYQACTTSDGTVFYGHGEYQEDIEHGALASFYLLGDFWILDAEGQRFDGAGEGIYTLTDGGGGSSPVSADLVYTGTWSDEASSGWLGQGASLTLFAGANIYAPDWNGRVEGAVELDGTSLYLDDLHYDTKACLGAPSAGAIRLREPSGYWHTLDFGEACTGCGSLTWADGSELGEICPDISSGLEAFFGDLLTAGGHVSVEGGP